MRPPCWLSSYGQFLDRFANWPVRIECTPASAAQRAGADPRAGHGRAKSISDLSTHKLLQSAGEAARFGLLIADDRAPVGVRPKERTSGDARADVDILTFATPIPRTLNMAGGMRDLSIIATPPVRRL